MFGFNRITSDPNILGGRACIRGMRISVSLIVNLVANGMTVEEIIDEYPDLEPEDIQQALHYAAWAAEDIVYIPEGVPA
ncbi:MAG: DUF433 domain-containing protein [Anaerolineae bacterium]